MSSAQPAAKRGVRPQALTHNQAGLPARRGQEEEEEEEEGEEAAAAPLPQFDALWLYDCVVSPLPRSSRLPLPPAINAPSSALAASPPPPPSPLAANARPFQRLHLLQRVFTTFDENQDGRVSTHEILRIFERLGIPQNESSIESLLARLGTKWEGHVDEQEFYLLCDSVCSTVGADSSSSSVDDDVEQDLLDAFHVFDKDGNGFISPSELQSVLCSLGFAQARRLDACVDMIARVDEDGDGQVDFFEFRKLFHTEHPSLLVSSF